MNNLNNSFGLGQTNCNRFPETLLVGITKPNKFTGRLKMQFLKEQIKPIKDYEELYSISNYGYVISEARELLMPNGGVHRKERTILASGLNGTGYPIIALCKNGKKKTFKVHLLVWDNFGDSLRNGQILQVDHIDEDKTNPRIDNLQLLTNRQNISKYFKIQKTSSKYTGVYRDNATKKWKAKIQINGKIKHLGYFDDEYKAHLAYEKAKIMED